MVQDVVIYCYYNFFINLRKIIWKDNFYFFSNYYKYGTTETTNCSCKNLKQNVRGAARNNEQFRAWKDKKEDNIIIDIKTLFRITKIDDNITKNIRNLFRLKKENEAIKDTIITNIRNLFEQEKEDYYKPVRVANF